MTLSVVVQVVSVAPAIPRTPTQRVQLVSSSGSVDDSHIHTSIHTYSGVYHIIRMIPETVPDFPQDRYVRTNIFF